MQQKPFCHHHRNDRSSKTKDSRNFFFSPFYAISYFRFVGCNFLTDFEWRIANAMISNRQSANFSLYSKLLMMLIQQHCFAIIRTFLHAQFSWIVFFFGGRWLVRNLYLNQCEFSSVLSVVVAATAVVGFFAVCLHLLFNVLQSLPAILHISLALVSLIARFILTTTFPRSRLWKCFASACKEKNVNILSAASQKEQTKGKKEKIKTLDEFWESKNRRNELCTQFSKVFK